MSWDGIERRKVSRMEDAIRDKIIETHTDVKHITEWAKNHTIDDDKKFATITSDINNGKRIIWGGVGIISAVELIMKFIK